MARTGHSFAFSMLKRAPAWKKYTTAGRGGCDKYQLWIYEPTNALELNFYGLVSKFLYWATLNYANTLLRHINICLNLSANNDIATQLDIWASPPSDNVCPHPYTCVWHIRCPNSKNRQKEIHKLCNRSPITIEGILCKQNVAHCYAIYLCSWDVEI